MCTRTTPVPPWRRGRGRGGRTGSGSRTSGWATPTRRARPAAAPERAQRAVVAVVPGEGLAGLYAEAGATTVLARPGEPPASGELVEAVRRAHAREVVLLPNDADLRHTAAAAAEQARTEGVRVALIPTRSAVQGIAALAVHEPERRFDEDVVAMTSAAPPVTPRSPSPSVSPGPWPASARRATSSGSSTAMSP